MDAKYPHLEKVRDEMARCSRCASCQAVCPVYRHWRDEGLTARGKIVLAESVLENRLEITPKLERYFSECLNCMHCASNCASGVDTIKVFSAVRAEGVDKHGLDPLTAFAMKRLLDRPALLGIALKVAGIAAAIYKMIPLPKSLVNLLPFVSDGTRRSVPPLVNRNLRSTLPERISPEQKPRGRVAYFTGCLTDTVYPGSGKAVVDFLVSAGYEVVIPAEQVCCGTPAYYSGDMATARKLAEQNLAVFDKLDAEAVIVSCGSCGGMIKERYAEFLGPENAERVFGKLYDAAQFAVEKGIVAQDAESGPGKIKVTYHDPCHLLRGMKVSAEPRQFIKSLPDVEYVELPDAGTCCGGAGTFSLKHYPESVAIGADKAESIRKTGAQVVVTACPSCQAQLRNSLDIAGMHNVRVMHILELAAERVAAGKNHARS